MRIQIAQVSEKMYKYTHKKGCIFTLILQTHKHRNAYTHIHAYHANTHTHAHTHTHTFCINGGPIHT
jgi:hypothetical protein